MTDLIDQAQEREQQQLAEALAAAKKPSPSLTQGRCNYCREPTDGLFCDADCRADYDYEQKIKARQRGER